MLTFISLAQIRLIRNLAAERVLDPNRRDAMLDLLKRHERPVNADDKLTQAWARACIDWLLNQPRATAQAKPATVAPSVEPLVAGVYGRDGEVFLVKPSRQGNLYAKRLVPISGERLTQLGETAKFEFDYAPGAVKTLHPRDRLPLAEAEKLMIEYGRCICCNRRLKDAASVRAGIGPVCRKQFA